MDVRIEKFRYDRTVAKEKNYPILMNENSEKLSEKFDLDKDKIIVEKGKVDFENKKEFFEYESGGIFNKNVLKERELVIKFEKEVDAGKDAYLVADEILSYFLEKQDFNLELIYTKKDKKYLDLGSAELGETEYDEDSGKVYNVYLTDTDVEVKVSKQFKVSLVFTITVRTANDIGATDNYLRTGKIYFDDNQFKEEVLDWRVEKSTSDYELPTYLYSSLSDIALDSSEIYDSTVLEHIFKDNKNFSVYITDIDYLLNVSKDNLILRKGNFSNLDVKISDKLSGSEFNRIATELKQQTDANNKIFCNVLNFRLIDGVFVTDDKVKLNASSISSSSTTDEIKTMFENTIKSNFDLKYKGLNLVLFVFFAINKTTNTYDYRVYTSDMNNTLTYVFRNKYI